MKYIRKSIAVIMSILICMISVIHVSAEENCSDTAVESTHETIGTTTTEEIHGLRPSVDPAVVEMLLSTATDISANSATVRSGLSLEQIDEELAFLYLELEQATLACAEQNSEENRNHLAKINARVQMLESDLQQYGFKCLNKEEAAALLGISNVSPASIYDEPPANWNTQNARVVVSPVYSVTLSTGEVIPYYYVTAYNTTTDSNLVDEPSIPIEKKTMGDFFSALIQTYAAKIAGAVVGQYTKVLEWLPYEMITYNNIPSAAADYTVEAVYTTTARWIWAYSEYGGRYYHEATVHSTSIANHHVLRYSYNGNSEIDSYDENYTVSTQHFNSVRALVKERWENGETSILLERVANVKYYYKEDESSTAELVQSVPVPYLQYAIELN